MRATHPFTTALREMRVCVCARACVHVCELRVLSTLLLFLLQFLPEPNADSVWSIRLPICHPAGSQLLTPSMREAIPHEWQPLVIQKATNLSGDQSSIPGSGRSPGGGYGNPPVFLPGESHGQRSRTGYSPWGQKELDTTEQLTQASGYYLCYVNDSFETFCIVSGHINWDCYITDYTFSPFK